jgi:hypothetical protein
MRLTAAGQWCGVMRAWYPTCGGYESSSCTAVIPVQTDQWYTEPESLSFIIDICIVVDGADHTYIGSRVAAFALLSKKLHHSKSWASDPGRSTDVVFPRQLHTIPHGSRLTCHIRSNKPAGRESRLCQAMQNASGAEAKITCICM